jgi:two-component system CheB/CheR fusion protein
MTVTSDGELQATRDRLRLMSLELAAARHELLVTAEEYRCVTEELQSAGEEMVTSKEELQAVNEELHTVNADLADRNGTLLRANGDLLDLFDSASVATLVLDHDLRIRRFTRKVSDIFRLRDGDRGRKISDIASRLSPSDPSADIGQVLRSLVPMEREVAVPGGASYLMQIRPYRSRIDDIDGVVVSFVDISERKQHEQARARLAAIVESSQDGIISHDIEGVITSWNAGAEHLYGYTAAEAIGRPMALLMDGTFATEWPLVLEQLKLGHQIAHYDSGRIAKDGKTLDVSITVSPMREEGGRVVGASVMARDISDRKAAEQRAALLLGELDHRVKNILAIVSAVVSQTLKTGLPPAAFAAEIEGRIKSIAQAHSLLTEAGEGTMSLRAALETELAPYGRGERTPSHIGDNITIAGPNVALTPKAGLAIAMAMHELSSNAAKYGALSSTSGRITVAWVVTEDAKAGQAAPVLTLSWSETGGPPVLPPTRRGFGTTLIERTMAYEFDAEVRRDFLPCGLSCVFVIPLTGEVGQLREDRGGEDLA